LLAAGAKYVAAHRPLADLSPLTVQTLGLIPANWVSTDDVNVHTQNALWLGLWPPDEIAVGVEATRETAGDLVARYGRTADKIYFPFPFELGTPVPSGTPEELVMVFRPEGLAQALQSER
jgi:hypothetical protein